MDALEIALPDLLRQLRKTADMTQAQLAERLCAITGTWTLTRHEVGRWEQGRVRPDAWLPALAEALDVDLEVLERAPSKTAGLPGPGDQWRQVSELLRRSFLQQGIALTALPVAGTASGQGQRVIQALEVLGHSHLGEITDGLRELVDHYAMTICSLPPGEVYDELLAIRAHAGVVLERAGTSPQRTDVAHCVGWLSHLLSIAACDMGEHATARVWCSDTERRSKETGLPELAAWSMLTRAMIAFYQGQPRHSVTIAAQGQQLARVGAVVHAKLASQEMRSSALAGDADRMASSRRHAAQAIAALPNDAATTGAFSINLAEDPPYLATSLLLLGRHGEAVDATHRVIDTVYQPETRQRGEHPSGYARALLILGHAYAGVGRLDEAAEAGHAALSGPRPAWPTMVLAGKLDSVLTQTYGHAEQAAGFHARYVEASQPKQLPRGSQ